jgi:hypothetical protein
LPGALKSQELETKTLEPVLRLTNSIDSQVQNFSRSNNGEQSVDAIEDSYHHFILVFWRWLVFRMSAAKTFVFLHCACFLLMNSPGMYDSVHV